MSSVKSYAQYLPIDTSLHQCTTRGFMAVWTELLKESFDYSIPWSEVAIPEREADYDWLIAVPQNLRVEQVLQVMSNLWRVAESAYVQSKTFMNEYTDLRPRDIDYVIWVRGNMETDEHLRGTSALQVRERGISGITLLERLLLELLVFRMYKQHLDQGTWTLCTGTHNTTPDGTPHSPLVYWQMRRNELTISFMPDDRIFEWCGTREVRRNAHQ